MVKLRGLVEVLSFFVYTIFIAEATYYSAPTGCHLPRITNAGLRGQHNFFVTYNSFMQYSVGATITLICRDGYKVAARSSIYEKGFTTRCTAQGWSPALTGVTCKGEHKVQCRFPDYTGLVIKPARSYYYQGESVTCSCKRGYQLIGQAVVKCLATGVFSTVPVCKAPTPKTCAYPGKPVNGIISPARATYIIGSTVSFSCNEGYGIIGSSRSQCLQSGQFSGKIPSCIKVQPKCLKPGTPAHGYLITVSEIKRHYSPGEYVMYQCKDGYALHGAVRSHCTSAGVFKPNVPICKRKVITCAFPGEPDNGETVPKTSTYAIGQSVNFLCNLGFTTVGAKSSTCTSSGKFSSAIPTCIKTPTKCPYPGKPEDGSTTPETAEYAVGKTVTFTCKDGYELDGSVTATCLSSGKFSSNLPLCKVIVKCPKPQLPSGGILSIISAIQETYAVGETVEFRCSEGYRLNGVAVITCAASGQFQEDVPSCEIIVKCSNPQLPSGGVLRVISAFKEKYSVGEAVEFGCSNGYRLIGVKITTCGATGQFEDKVPSCEEIPTCLLPSSPANGRFFAENAEGSKYFEGDTIQYKCNDAFELIGAETLTCQKQDGNLLAFVPEVPTCRRPRCDDPEEPGNGRLISDTNVYVEGVTVIYECRDGYRLVGKDISKCTREGSQLLFQPAAPSCERKTCDPPLRSPYLRASPRKSAYFIKDEILFDCLSGFVLVGQRQVECVDQDLYSDEIPTCKNIRCARPSRLRNGQISPFRTDYGIGDSIRFSCRIGYRLAGDEESSCTLTSENEATFTPDIPTCEKITCQKPSVPNNGDMFPDRASYALNDAVRFSCDLGYELAGEEEIICVGQDRYSDQEPECKVITCQRPPRLDNGFIVESARIFEYQDTISYRCNDGYVLEGSNIRTCQATAEFSFRAPTCKEITCQIPSFIRNGDVSPRTRTITYKSVVSFTCDSGYNLVGAETATCKMDGTLSDRSPKCEAVTCDAPAGSSTYSYFPIKSQYAIGDGITFTCARGYKIVGRATGECLQSGKFNTDQIRCDRITCSRPGSILNGNVVPAKSTYAFGELIEFTCTQGYNLVGLTSATCGENGFALQALPTCEPFTCPSPGFLQFGSIEPRGMNYKFGETIEFACNTGYKLEGATSSTCQLGGRFSQAIPVCRRVTCDLVAIITSGSIYPPQRRYFVGDRVSFTCDYGFKLNGAAFTTCGSDGRFSDSLPTCSALTCKNPGAPSFGSITPNRPTYNVGDDVTYQCNDNYRLRGATVATCVDENLFSVRKPTCEEIGCSFPGNPENGFTEPVRPTYATGDSIKFECRPGFVIDGIESTKCGVGGSFEEDLPICGKINCDNPGSPRFGEIFPDRVQYGLGQRVSFRCSEGFELKGSSVIRCEESGFSDPIPSCIPVTCPFPGSPTNGKTVGPRKTEYSVNDVITFECDEGYELTGLESSRCSSSGRFSGFLPTCKVAFCANPGAPRFGSIIPYQPKYAVGDSISYSCLSGYQISGVTSAVCLSSGNFSEGTATCQRKTCAFPGVPKNGFTSPVSLEYKIGDVVTYSCSRGYEVSGFAAATCLSSGKFSEGIPMCTEQSCKNPGSPSFGSINPDFTSYAVNQKVTYNCNEGYQLKGSQIVTCGANGRFSGRAPTCERVICEFPGNPANGFTSPTRANYEVGEEISFECVEGFTLVGVATSECTKEGTFADDLPSCTRSACTFPGRPAFGYTSPNKPIFAIDESVVYSCKRGYVLVGQSNSQCGDDGHFNSDIPTCKRASCKFPGNPTNGDTFPTKANFNFRDRVSFKCRDGYNLVGAEFAACLASGSFSEAVPQCERVACKNPGKLVFGSVAPIKAMYSVDDVINFKCNGGYELVGSRSAVCNEEGEFSEAIPTCQRITCSFPGNPSNGATVPRQAAYTITESVTFECDDGYVIVGERSASCGKNGKFTEALPICQRIKCRSLGLLVNGDISPDLNEYSDLDTIYFTCSKGYKLLGKSSSVCQSDGTFSNVLPKCQRNVCLKPPVPLNGKVFPDLTAYAVGQRVTFSCKDGYMLMGESVIECGERGSFDKAIPKCREITCAYPGVLSRGAIFPSRSSYSIAEVVEFSCDKGYVLVGDTTSTCGTNGEFDIGLPTCERRKCDNPGRPQFGQISPDFLAYTVGQEVQFTCTDGYKLVGSRSLMCNSDGSFSGSIPSCAAITCKYPGEPANGETVPRDVSYSVGELVKFQCAEGYVLKGFTSARCTESGRFSVDLPTCNARTCAFPGNPIDGLVTPSQVSYKIGDSVSYECRKGYNLVGKTTRKCMTSGVFAGIAPSCTQRTCRNSGKLVNGFVTPNLPQYAVGQIVTFTCSNGYRLRGSSSSTCLESGKFSNENPQCERVPVCRNPGAPLQGTISSTRPLFDVKDSVTYTCEYGYRLEGAKEAECLRSGRFSLPKPSCMRITCAFPGKPSNGATTPRRETYSLGDVVRYTCKSEYKRVGSATATCNENGEFSANIPRCARKSCANPGAPKFGTMTPDELNYVVGQTVTFSCNFGYGLRGGSESTCGEDERFITPFPTCERITCRNLGSPAFVSVKPDSPGYNVGATITYVCSDGYVTDESTEAVCMDSGRFSNPPPTCRKKRCRRPALGDYVFISPSLPFYSIGQRVQYSCPDGYELIGQGRSRCGDDGKFTSGSPFCKLIIISCPFPGHPTDGLAKPRLSSYEVGDRVDYECNRGYVISGASSSICTNRGNFSRPAPTCRLEICSNPGVPLFGSVFPDIPTYTVGEKVSYSCKDGYIIDGVKENVCGLDGKFRYQSPVCKRITCSNPGKLDYGAMSPDLTTYSIGDSVTYTCTKDYVIVGNSQRTCLKTGRFSGQHPSCQRKVTCLNPGPLAGGSIHPNRRFYEVGQRITYTCDAGYKIQGRSSAECKDTSEWTNPLPTCRIATCKNPGKPRYGTVFPDNSEYSPGQTVRYFCAEGYRLDGYVTAKCVDGEFDKNPPRCRAITCLYPGTPSNGKTIPRKSMYLYNETVEYKCTDGYETSGYMTARCTGNGKFSNAPPTCRRMTCRVPDKPNSGKFEPIRLTYYIDDVITYECNTGYELKGDRTATCQTNGYFSSETPACIRRTCRNPGAPENGSISPRQRIYDITETIRYRCDPGFKRVGADSAVCQNDGEFSEDPPNCRRITCKYPGAATNGKTTPFRRQYNIDDVVIYECDEDLELVGQRSAKCLSTGEFSAQPPKCRAVRCQYPGAPVGGVTIPQRSLYKGGDVVTFKCENDCEEIIGNSTAVCMSDGYFSANTPICRRKQCNGHPGIPKYGMVKPLRYNYTCGEKVKYVCKNGFRRAGTLESYCRPNGKFDGATPTCEVVTCGAPPSIRNGAVATKKTRIVSGDLIAYRCKVKYQMIGQSTIRCDRHGKYEGEAPICRAVTCRAPSPPRHGTILSGLTKGDYKPGDAVEFECDEHYMLVGNAYSICQVNGEWQQSFPTCQEQGCERRCLLPKIPDLPCQCDKHCQSRGDCCDDYQAKCVSGSCKNRCGEEMTADNQCSCNSLCSSRFGKHCCYDYKTVCEDYNHRNSNSSRSLQGQMGHLSFWYR